MVLHPIKRVIALGPRKTIQRVVQKAHEKARYYYWKNKAYQGTATHSWHSITDKHTYHHSIDYFYTRQQSQYLSFVSDLYQHIDNTRVLSDADLFVRNCFDLLGSGVQQFADIPWHKDFRLHMQNPDGDCTFPADIFCKDAPLRVGKTRELTKDIKIPWELSRFYHAYVLGKAFEITGDTTYVQTVCKQISDWLHHNPYLFGVNWLCPMEVGLRAVNWIIGFDFIKQEVSPLFFERFVCSLYDHAMYLENNWEIYDGKTSNHYLSDLLGYFYVCWFFKDLPGFTHKRDWCFQEFLREWDRQVCADGTLYEGSTAYHRLVTEIFYHFCVLCTEFGLDVPEQYGSTFNAMVNFIEWCMPVNGSLVTIGDNDSGRVLWYPPSLQLRRTSGHNLCERRSIKHFPNFGLSIIKNEQWHVTMRHHAYTNRQLSGHYHVDIGSITIALNGTHVITDPGSYIYTPSAYWRNYFRSVHAHNSFFMTGHEPISVDDRLFALDLPEHIIEHTEEQDNCITMTHDLYQSRGLRACRTASLVENQLVINDWWQSDVCRTIDTTWGFTLGPEINIECNSARVICFYDSTVIATIESPDLVFNEEDGWFSPHYGTKVPTKRLQARRNIDSWQKVVITVTTMG